MSFLTRLFKKRPDEDYESILSALALDIQKRQTKLSELRLRERRATLLVTTYTLAAWVAYVSLWYWSVLPKFTQTRGGGVEKAVKGFPVVVGPIVILFVRRIVQIWYARKGDAEEKTLQALLKQQRTKVEEIKKKTNYYSTRDLLQRYDESPANSPLRQRIVPGGMATQPTTPQRQPPPQQHPTPNTGPNPNMQSPIHPALINPLSPSPYPQTPPRKQWYDKLADALLGDDGSPQTTNPNATRYALICENCFAHNGLVKESMWEDAQYICPKCGHFNPSARSKKEPKSKSKSKSKSPSHNSISPPSSPPSPSSSSTLGSPIPRTAPSASPQRAGNGGAISRGASEDPDDDTCTLGDVSMADLAT